MTETAAPLPGLAAVVFDMDGLLANTEPLSFRAKEVILARDYGIVTTAEDEDWAAVTVGKSGLESWELVRDRFNLPLVLPRDYPPLERQYKAVYQEIIRQGVAPMPGARELVRACHAAGLRLGVASSSAMDDIHTVLTQLGIIDLFAALTSGKEVPQSKPDPAIYRLACVRLDVDPAACVALEDSGPGVLAARDAGLRCLAVPSDYTATHDFSRASAIVPSLVGLTPADLAALPR